MNREKLAREAFWGGNENLADAVREKHSYEMNGVLYPANSLSLEEFISTVEGMSEDELRDRLPVEAGNADGGREGAKEGGGEMEKLAESIIARLLDGDEWWIEAVTEDTFPYSVETYARHGVSMTTELWEQWDVVVVMVIEKLYDRGITFTQLWAIPQKKETERMKLVARGWLLSRGLPTEI